MPDAQTQTESRDLEVARLRAQVAYLKHALAYADSESIRARAESAAVEELEQCQRRVLQLHAYNKKLSRLTEILSKRLGLPNFSYRPASRGPGNQIIDAANGSGNNVRTQMP